MSRVTPFPWYGGKYNQCSWIIEHFPNNRRYVEPFGGSGVILINKDPSPIETFNDIDGEVVNFFEVLQKYENELIHRVENTPHSREFFEKACTEEPDDEVERALYFLIRTAQSYGGTQMSWGSSVTVTRKGMPQRTSAWNNRIESIKEVAKRMREVQIENRDAIDLIQRHDGDDVTFYCDPPYPQECRVDSDVYNYEMDDDEHEELAEVLNSVEGDVVLSSYECESNNEWYDGWRKEYQGERTLAGEGTGSREEVLYMNF